MKSDTVLAKARDLSVCPSFSLYLDVLLCKFICTISSAAIETQWLSKRDTKIKWIKKKHQPETFHFPECSLTEHPLEFSFNLGIFAPCLFRTLCRSVHFHETDVANEDMPLWLLLFSTLSLPLSLLLSFSLSALYQLQFNSTMFSFCRFFLHPSDLFTTTLPPRFTLPTYSKLLTLTQNYTNIQKTPSICLMQHIVRNAMHLPKTFSGDLRFWHVFNLLSSVGFYVELNSQIQLPMSESIKLIKNIENDFLNALPSGKKN